MMSVSDEEYISPNEVSARRLEESAAYFAENMADASQGRRRSSARPRRAPLGGGCFAGRSINCSASVADFALRRFEF